MDHKNLTALREIASLFSRTVFLNVLNYQDYSPFYHIASKYDFPTSDTYLHLLNKAYILLCDNYRNEYVFKNAVIAHILSTEHTKECALFNEFRVGNSIADMAIFEDESVAFEIKTAYDTTRRLSGQMETYHRLFDRCYLVIPEESMNTYIHNLPVNTGILTLSQSNNQLILIKQRDANRNETFDPKVMMPYLRTDEYKRIAISLGGNLTGVPGYEWYNYCQHIIENTDSNTVRELFLQEMRNRKNNVPNRTTDPPSVRQMILSLNLPLKKSSVLLDLLSHRS